jgi:kynurenine formamidase
MAQFIDLSVPIEPTPSEATAVTIDTLEHADAPEVLGLRPEDFPDGLAISNEVVTLTTHTGTHVDAPLHYGPSCAGLPARSIGEVPLEWCFGEGFRLDVRWCQAGEGITVADVSAAVALAERPLRPGDIALLWTGSDRLWGSARYRSEYPGLTREATAYLLEHGVRVIGIDAWGLDRPFTSMLDDYRSTGDRSQLWPAHLYGREREYLQIEKLANLDRLPGATGFHVACFPVHVAKAGAGWTRVVAITEPAWRPRWMNG